MCIYIYYRWFKWCVTPHCFTYDVGMKTGVYGMGYGMGKASVQSLSYSICPPRYHEEHV